MSESFANFVLSHDVYEQDAVVEAAQAFAAHLSCHIVRSADDEMEIALYLPPTNPVNDSAIDEFLNHALDLSIRRKIGRS